MSKNSFVIRYNSMEGSERREGCIIHHKTAGNQFLMIINVIGKGICNKVNSMRKVSALIGVMVCIVFCMIMTTAVYARTPKKAFVKPGISIHQTEATCTVDIAAGRKREKIVAEIKLWKGSACVATWHKTSYGHLRFRRKAKVTKGNRYSLSVLATIGGVRKPLASVSVQN